MLVYRVLTYDVLVNLLCAILCKGVDLEALLSLFWKLLSSSKMLQVIGTNSSAKHKLLLITLL